MQDVMAEEGMLMGRSYNYATFHLEEFGKLKNRLKWSKRQRKIQFSWDPNLVLDHYQEDSGKPERIEETAFAWYLQR